MNKPSIILFTILLALTAPAQAHGGPELAVILILIWGLIPILVISLVVVPLSLLLGRLLHWKRKMSVVIGIGVSILIYLLVIPHMQAIMNWVVDLQYYFD